MIYRGRHLTRTTRTSMSRANKGNGPIMRGKRLSPPASGGFEAVCEQRDGKAELPVPNLVAAPSLWACFPQL